MQIEVMSLRGSQWLQLFLEQAQIGQMVEHWCKEHPVACSTYYHWKKALREEFLARMEAEQGHPILQTAVTVLFNQSEGCLRLLSATGLPSTKTVRPLAPCVPPTGQKTRTVVPRIAVGLCINRLQSGDNVQ